MDDRPEAWGKRVLASLSDYLFDIEMEGAEERSFIDAAVWIPFLFDPLTHTIAGRITIPRAGRIAGVTMGGLWLIEAPDATLGAPSNQAP